MFPSYFSAVLCGKEDFSMSETQKKVLITAGVCLSVYLGMKYVLRLTAPFFIAWLLVRLMNPLAEAIHRKISLRKEWVTIGLLGAFLAVFACGFYFLLTTLFKQIRSVVANLDFYKKDFQNLLDGCCLVIEQSLGIEMEDTMTFLNDQAATLTQRLSVSVVPQIFTNSIQGLMNCMKGAGALFLVFLAVTLLMRDYDAIRESLSSYPLFRHLSAITSRIFTLGGAWLKSQLLILLIVCCICVAGLWILRNPYALLLGILIGVLDALPFLGTGTVFLPWALVCCIRQNFYHAAAYATIFLVANTTREYLEPKLLGGKLGVYPIVIALVVYVGLCIYGPSGVLLGPLSLLIIMEILGEFEIFPTRRDGEKKQEDISG